MAELGAGSGSGYPGALDTNATVEVDSPASGKTKARADVPNDLAASIIAVQTELGTDPAGSLTDVKTYLQTEHGADGTHTAASTTASGVVELATDAETKTGSDTGRVAAVSSIKAMFTEPYPLGATTPNTIKGSSFEGATGATITGFADEDTMSSDSATLGATQQSIKAYVDDNQKLVEVHHAVTNTEQTGTTSMPADNTIPQNDEGDQFHSIALTPSSASNILLIDATIQLAATTSDRVCTALFQDTTADALVANTHSNEGGTPDEQHQCRIVYKMVAGTTSSTTFKLRAGQGAGAGTVTCNGSTDTTLDGSYGGKAATTITVWEYKP